MRRRALICGASGQDGAYLAALLLQRGYTVFATSRDCGNNSFAGLERLAIRDKVVLHSMQTTDFRSVLSVLQEVSPEEVYNLSGQSSVSLSFDQPLETFNSVTAGTVNLLECLRYLGRDIRFYNAASSEMFGDTGGRTAEEGTAFHPMSPYATAKAASYWAVDTYRRAYGLYACSGILFNHESPLRPARFVTMKIVAAAARIHAGSREVLTLGNLAIARDWGWAPDYVEAMWRMLQQERPDDYVVATGRTHTLEEFVAAAFALFGLNWRDHVRIDQALFRASEISYSAGNPARAEAELGWKARYQMEDVVRLMAESVGLAPKKILRSAT
jgi:GDPmannose 4,6-dehydratase